MNRIALVLVIVALGVQPVAADSEISFLPLTSGQRVHYRIMQTAQTANGPQTSTAAFDLVRRTGGAVVVERSNPNGTPNLSVLKTVAGGSLALAEDPSAAAADADIAGLLVGINLAIAATQAGDASSRAAWTATLPLATTPGAGSATVSLVPANVAGNDFDFSGTGSPALPASSAPPPERRGGRRESGRDFPGGGLGGAGGGPRAGSGGFPGPGGSSGGRATSRNGITYVLHVEGRVSGGRVRNITITETRSVTVANTPFFNVASWAITVLN